MSSINPAPTKPTLTCLACKLKFEDGNAFKLHHKSEWHRYNLKRNLVNLPSVSLEEFQQKEAHFRKAQEEADMANRKVHCDPCKKWFANVRSYNSHLNSKKHRDNERSFEQDKQKTAEEAKDVSKHEKDSENGSEVEEVDSDEWDGDTNNPIDNNDCLFCSHHSRNFYVNLEHMTLAHSFFIPDIEYCVDVESLLRCLGDKVNTAFMCLWCNDRGRTFHSAEAARQHMRDKGHCRMLYEDLALAEYSDYYDYSSSYPDAKEDGVDADEELDEDQTGGSLDSEFQLTLPSGAVIGHRSLMRYYRQSVNPNAVVVQPRSRTTRKLHKVLATYRALGWTATEQQAAARKARDIHRMKREIARHHMLLGVKANKLQTHFRAQVNF